MLGRYLRSHDPRLPRSVRTMEAGGLLSAFGNRITFPFLVIYLHNVRGFSLATAGLVLAAGNAIGLFAGPVAGQQVLPPMRQLPGAAFGVFEAVVGGRRCRRAGWRGSRG